MKRLLSRPLLALAVLLAAGNFAAAAQTVEADANAGTGAVAAAADADAEREVDRDCLQSTGSRIVAARNDDLPRNRDDGAGEANAKPDCVIGNGRVYTRKDLQSTGHVSVAEALRTLDPRIR